MDAEVLAEADPDSKAVNKIKNSLNKGRNLKLLHFTELEGNLPSSISSEPDILAGLLVRYLNELPEPLVPVTVYKAFMLTCSKKFKSGKDRGGVKDLRTLVHQEDFSRVHFHSLRRILTLLHVIFINWWSNKEHNTKIIDMFAINILRPDNLTRQVSTKDLAHIKKAVHLLIHYCPEIFNSQDAISQSDLASRRLSMIRRGERISLSHFDESSTKAINDVDNNTSKTTPIKSPSKVIEQDIRFEFDEFKEAVQIKIKFLESTIETLRNEIQELKLTKN